MAAMRSSARLAEQQATLASDEMSDDMIRWDPEEADLINSNLSVPPSREFGNMKLRPDHHNRPLWVCPNRHIFLETWSPIYKQAYDFLIAISDPVRRPRFIHEYKITTYSLYAAASLGLQTSDILSGLTRLSKNQLDPKLVQFITDTTTKCGKLRLLLKNTRYFIESRHRRILQDLLRLPGVATARIDNRPNYKAIVEAHVAQVQANLSGRRDWVDVLQPNNNNNRRPQPLAFQQNASSIRIFGQDMEAVSAANRAAQEAALRQAIQEMSAITELRDPRSGFLLTASPDSMEGVVIPGTAASLSDRDKVADQAAAMGLADLGDSKKNKKQKKTRKNQGSAEMPDDSDELDSCTEDDQLDDDDDDDENHGEGVDGELVDVNQVLSIELKPEMVTKVREAATVAKFPMLEEYDFRKDTSTMDLPIELKRTTQIRSYQEKSLSKMFGNGRARSGLIVLPCGAGKTLVGITATTTVAKSTIVFCTTGMAVEQWRLQFLRWSTLPASHIEMFTAQHKDSKFNMNHAKVVITTYSMFAHSGKRAKEAERIMKILTSHEWGLVVLDEVHVAPADRFRECVRSTHSFCKLGLTATLVREDDLINDLYYLIGPKLYEANWMDLQAAGHLANVQCVEVWCRMPSVFYREYLTLDSDNRRRLLYTMNPAKLRACEYLINLHEKRGDKIMVFSDCVYTLTRYAETLRRPMIHGKTSNDARIMWLRRLRESNHINTLFISAIGDNSIDLPDVSVIIQISSHFAARRQEAQRLGRILRPKSGARSRYNAFFYSLVSKDTKEMWYATKRQRYLVDQGYAFKVVADIESNYDIEPSLRPTHMSTEREIQACFVDVMASHESEGGLESNPEGVYENLFGSYAPGDSDSEDEGSARGGGGGGSRKRNRAVISRRSGAGALSGAGGSVVYAEAGGSQQPASKKPKSGLEKKRMREMKKVAELERGRKLREAGMDPDLY